MMWISLSLEFDVPAPSGGPAVTLDVGGDLARFEASEVRIWRWSGSSRLIRASAESDSPIFRLTSPYWHTDVRAGSTSKED